MNARALRLAVSTALIAGLAVGAAAPVASAAAKPKSKQLTYRATNGDFALSLKAKRTNVGSQKRYTDLRLTLGQEGVVNGFQSFKIRGAAKESWGIKPFVFLTDVSGDGVPDGIVDIYTGGAHCCQASAIALSTGPSSWAKPFNQQWGGFYSLKDLGGNGVSEFIASDMRFDYAFTSHAGSAMPIVIKAVQGGKLVDVTTQYPAELQSDTQQWRDALADAVKEPPTDEDWANRQVRRALLAALLADLLRLNLIDEAKATVAASIARGDLSAKDKDEIWDNNVGGKLEEWGYTTDFKALGLPR